MEHRLNEQRGCVTRWTRDLAKDVIILVENVKRAGSIVRESILGPHDTDDLSNRNGTLAFTPNTVVEVYIHGDSGYAPSSIVIRDLSRGNTRGIEIESVVSNGNVCGLYVRAVHCWEDSHRSRTVRCTLCKRLTMPFA